MRKFMVHSYLNDESHKNMPLISIVTPSFNQKEFIKDTLDSVAIQDYPNIEHLVIDGMSIDGTVDILRTLGETKRYRHMKWISETDRGQSEALNKGFRRAKGDIIGWLNSDDRYRPGCFEKVVQAFKNQPEVDIVYGDYTIVDKSGKLVKKRREIEFSRFILMYHRVLYIPTTATFFRRKIFEDKNYLIESFHYAMDSEFFMRIAGKKYCFKHLPVLLADFRLQPSSKTCSAPFMQQHEHDQIVLNSAPGLCRIKPMVLRRCLLSLLRLIAAFMRYSEKLLKGYYWK